MKLAPEALAGFAARAFAAVGVTPEAAHEIAQLVVDADLHGADTHGVFRLRQYIDGIREGAVNPRPQIHLVHESPASALLDGDNGVGHYVMAQAMRTAIAKAKAANVCWVGTRHSNHVGALGTFARLALGHDVVAICMSVSSVNLMAPWGGAELLLGTNPFAFVVPGGDEGPVVFDMSSSVVAYGLVRGAAQRGEAIPEGWMIDKQGRPLTDPKKALEGLVLPLGGAKGYGIALMVALLGGVLNGAAVGRDVPSITEQSNDPVNAGQTIVVANIAAFDEVTAFKARVDELVRTMRGAQRLPGVDAIRVPGERSFAIARERRASGVPMRQAVLQSLDQLARELGIAGPGG